MWRNFDVSILTYNHRQAEDRNWASLLNRIRLGWHSESDCAELLQRQKVDLTKPPFCNALRIFPRKADVEKHNLMCLQSQMRYSKLYKIIAKDVVVQAPDRLTPDEISHLKPYKVNDTAGLTEKLQLTVGSRVIIKSETILQHAPLLAGQNRLLFGYWKSQMILSKTVALRRL